MGCVWEDRGQLLRQTGLSFRQLKEIKGKVQAGSDAVTFLLEYDGIAPFLCDVPVEQMTVVMEEVRSNGCRLLNQQRLYLDRGANLVEGLVAKAENVQAADIVIDSFSTELVLVLQRPNDAPTFNRLTYEQAQKLHASLEVALYKRSH